MRTHSNGDREYVNVKGPGEATLTIGQIARRTGVPAKTIRFYEEIGLLPEPSRGSNSYRRYRLADLNRLLLLRRIRLLGLPLSSAKPLLIGASDARCGDVQRQLLSLVEQRLRAIDQEIAELHALRETVAGYQRALAACPPADNSTFSDCSDMRCIVPSDDAAPKETCDDETHGCCAQSE
ncbi:MAG TPA: MerR family DNA-binding transcriptional regulator [Ktedonobacterales bacterium]|jgi:MerR family transcriptional regulator, copper efflux regulator|nr:MerR family DNA-binding transcriptional regulator [Ktedonobacterales bacterium]